MTIDIVFTAWNRREFTEAAFRALLDNTDWTLIHGLHVYDDGSTDGTREHLAAAIQQAPVPAHLAHVGRHSPVAVMNEYVRTAESDWFVKIDNDACVPPGWLPTLLTVLQNDDTIDVLGMEAGMTQVAGRNEPWDGVYRFQDATHIGGIGIMRTSCFKGRRMIERGRYGFGHFQQQHDLRRGWITPDLPLVLLDRLPFEPWAGLSEWYVECGWQRPWAKWDPVWMRWAFEWFAPDAEIVAA